MLRKELNPHPHCNQEFLLVEKSRQTNQVGKLWIFWFMTSLLGHQLAGMGNSFLNYSLLVINLAMCNELVFGIALAQPTHCCSKGLESSTETFSWNFQDVTKHSKWNDAIPTESIWLQFTSMEKRVGTRLKSEITFYFI